MSDARETVREALHGLVRERSAKMYEAALKYAASVAGTPFLIEKAAVELNTAAVKYADAVHILMSFHG